MTTTIDTTSVVNLQALRVRIGTHTLLDDVDLRVAAGEIVAVTGPNGAGKTTLLDALCGYVPTEGTIEIGGRLARTHQQSPIPDTLTIDELLRVTTSNPSTVAQRFGLVPHLDTQIHQLSTGMRRIVDLAVTADQPHDVLLLDEPAAGLAHSELEHLARIIRDHVARTGTAVVLVEHNRALVDRVADRVIRLRHGRTIDTDIPTNPDEVAVDRPSTALEPIRTAIAAVGAPAPEPVRHEMSTWTKLRLGLREFGAGMASVLILGVLNRVMKVELGISLAVVAVVLASYNLAAPFAIAIGHRSDQKPIMGRHRAPYIVGGGVITALMVALAPHLADRLADGVSPLDAMTTIAAFAVMGVGMYGSGTVYFALIADLTPRHERAHAASVVYLMLMAGIMAGAGLSAALLDDDASGRHSLFALVAVLVVVSNVLAVWGLDRDADLDDLPEPTTASSAIREVAAIGPARRFFAFMVLATLFLFLQQAVLEPYGGEVLGLSVRATTGFNALQTIGVLAGMLITGRGYADRAGHKRTATIGLVGSAVSFAALAVAAAISCAPMSWFSILLIGLTTGLFNVAVLALMMAMSVPERIALFMGAWTVAHALADGLATAGGGTLQSIAVAATGNTPYAYAAVFGVQAIGLLACLPLLAGIDVTNFTKQVAAESARRSAATLGWTIPTSSSAK